MGEALFWYPLCTNPVEVYPNSHWAPVPAKILSHLGHFTERSCFVTQGEETDGEEANTEMSLVRVFFFFFSFRFPSFLPCMACHIHSACTRRLASMYVGGCGSNSPFSSLLSSAISTSWSHLLLKPVIHPSSLYAPQNQPQAQPRPRDPCPHRGSWIMYGGIQWDGGFATAPTMTYITPVALSIPCDFPVCGQMYPHVRTWSLAKKKTIQSVKRADISTDAWL